MKILYVVARPLSINTSASIRNKATIDGFIRLGHVVDIITVQSNQEHSNYDASLVNEKFNISYIKLGGVQNAIKRSKGIKQLNFMRNIIYSMVLRFSVYDNLKKIVNYVDDFDINDNMYNVVISSSDPKSSHLFIEALYKKDILIKTPWIQIWGDPFLSDISRKNAFLSLRIKREEDRLLNLARHIIYVSNLTLIEQKEIYLNYANKMYYFPTPFHNEIIYTNNNLDKKNLAFLYCGDYPTIVRNIMPLYNAMKLSEHKLIICGNSNLKLDNTENVKIYPRSKLNEIQKLEHECDVLVHLSNLKGSQIPGKIFQISGTNKPILFILDGKMDELKNSFNNFNRYVFSENDQDCILKTIKNFEIKNRDLDIKPIDKFKPIHVAEGILDLLSK